MQISFETQFLRELCLKAAVAEEHFSPDLAASLFSALADIKAAETATDLFLGEFVEGECGALPIVRMSFGDCGRIDLVSNHPHHNGPTAERVDWSQVRRVRIVEIKHDGN